ncbi:MAG TPA: hypothetical protein DEF42_17805 [Desulfosporosinus sp.]|nr:hypothetical protein [Desulfosporosinus sp.]
MTKRGKLTIFGFLILSVVLLAGISIYRNSQGGNSNLAGVPVQGVEAIADYHLIPIINAQSTDMKQVYLNTEATPSLFFATWSDQSQEVVSAIQDKLSKTGSGMHKPLVLVSTFVKTTDQRKAITEAKAFQEKDNLTLPIAVQVGPPTEFVKQVPSLVYTDGEGTHIVTDENEILDSLDAILALPASQPTTPVEK